MKFKSLMIKVILITTITVLVASLIACGGTEDIAGSRGGGNVENQSRQNQSQNQNRLQKMTENGMLTKRKEKNFTVLPTGQYMSLGFRQTGLECLITIPTVWTDFGNP